ncbi:cyclohexanone 1,2-monooxygenase [Dothidotthia symphoricarpi CBS 119687]|uniref:Cyclohexanone 1,2-monooxygenase n=1 Tax=Dothidotthia symphoricarpi CBS 119687 TaxID=1392245 RepID=A0A6A6ANC6_9PLEO|nr:cyclohexanone 1,2-monooxygenase [Dothidotthia symphoricarpi CBS 119687]KAF2131991.1 cyclohexanone 1,2-monooxygenase [Dothidotthia symphoricarpi CBS 119687]
MSFDTEVLIIGAGCSGLGLAIQIIRQYGIRNFELVEKSNDVGGTWLANSYPGCGCDVASHFYSYSFALNPEWSRKYSLREEIQEYFRSVAEQYRIVEHVRFHSVVEKAEWDDMDKVWKVTVLNVESKEKIVRRAKILISGVGSLSVPKRCDIRGMETFDGKVFHSAQWDHSFDWGGKDVVVLGNGCSATQFLPIMASPPNPVRSITQFARQAQYLSERTNPYYTPTFKAVMRYVPLAMRLYRAKFYYDMERDYSGFSIEHGRPIRDALAKENEAYVKKMAPQKYWDALIPKTEIGCKRKILDTEYLASLWKDHVELVCDDPVERFVEDGVLTRSGREVRADAVVLAIGFATQQMLFPMEIIGRDGLGLREHWENTSQGIAQAYFGTVIPHFPNFFTLMGPNTVTGHLSVIYTVECQINFTLRVLDPVLKSLPSYRSRSWLPAFLAPTPTTVEVQAEAALADSAWIQREAKKLVWASGCTNWAVDPKTGINNMMYPGYQFTYWLRSVFWKRNDFAYRDEKTGEVIRPDVKGRMVVWALTIGALAGVFVARDWIIEGLPERLKGLRGLRVGRG